jgi:GT2 family glycosyltransferase
MNFEVIIPTYKREQELKNCLDSIYSQNLMPKRIIIIDDDFLPPKFISKEKTKFLKKNVNFFHYVKDHSYEPRGSNESRNKGIDLAKEEIVFIFDDDVILEKDFFSEIMKVWKEKKTDNNLIGVGGVIKNNRRKSRLEKIYNIIFGLSSKYNWDVNDAGFQVWDDHIKKQEKGYYIHGGACSYKKLLVDKVGGFAIFRGGRGGGVDPDFSLRSKNKGYYFIIEPEAKVIHKKNETFRENSFLSGFKDIYNRKTFFNHNCKKSFKNYIHFYWANIGWILRKVLVGHFLSVAGMIKGLFYRIK